MNGDPVDAATGRNISHGNTRKRNNLFRFSPSHLQVILAINHLVGETMELHSPKKIKQKTAENTQRNHMGYRISLEATIQEPGSRHKHHQRRRTEPHSALKQWSVFK